MIIYDIEKAKEDMTNLAKHIIRDVQQNKAKVGVMEKTDDSSILCLKDWSQKVPPLTFKEPQRDYSGKKGMSQHVDVIYSKKDNKVIKNVYFTLLQRCDQNLNQTLAVIELVAKEIKKDLPDVHNAFMKSDNAGCYSGNGALEGEHFILSRLNLKLKHQ